MLQYMYTFGKNDCSFKKAALVAPPRARTASGHARRLARPGLGTPVKARTPHSVKSVHRMSCYGCETETTPFENLDALAEYVPSLHEHVSARHLNLDAVLL